MSDKAIGDICFTILICFLVGCCTAIELWGV